MTPVLFPLALAGVTLGSVAVCMLWLRMPLTRPLLRRFLEHLPLCVGAICLLAAGFPFYDPRLLPLLWPLPPLMLAAALFQGRWVLPAWAANLLGVVIAGGGVAWMGWHVFGPSAPWLLPLPTALVPHLGPILLSLLTIKLYRPRQDRDFWMFQGMGLLQVGLACALTVDLLFGALLLVYLACLLTALALRESAPEPAAAPPRSPGLLLRCLTWTLLISGVALGCFLLTPRPSGSWDPRFRFFGRASPNPDQTITGIDLNTTGPVTLTHDVAFTVTATHADGTPLNDLPADQRWRGRVLDIYQNGHWTARSGLGISLFQASTAGRAPPDFSPEQYRLDFLVHRRRTGGTIVAEPYRLTKDGSLPILSLEGGPAPRPFDPNNTLHYRQIVPADPDRERMPVFVATGMEERQVFGWRTTLREPPPDPIPQWTADLLVQLLKNPRYGLEPSDLDPPPAFVPGGGRPSLVPANAERVARALSRYLSESGDYTYTLERPRQDRDLDPTADFLINVKAGHCERFAAGLTLMLRSRGIPCRVVTGYKGAERTENGVYLVRQSNAHAWTEVLVPHPGGTGELDWLALDPTPAGDLGEENGSSMWQWLLDRFRFGPGALWRELVVNYGSDRQSELWESLQPTLPSGRVLFGWCGGLLLAGVTTAWLRRRWRRTRSDGAQTVLPLYDRLLLLLARHGHAPPKEGRTPREYAEAAAAALASDVPPRIVALYYRVRYGGLTATAEETRELTSRLDGLEASLGSKENER
jgi:transglutaminase-like putative cysteine protease